MTVIVQQPTDSNGNPQPMVYDSDTGKIIVDSNGYVINGGKRLINVPTVSEYVSTTKTQTAGIQEAVRYAISLGTLNSAGAPTVLISAGSVITINAKVIIDNESLDSTASITICGEDGGETGSSAIACNFSDDYVFQGPNNSQNLVKISDLTINSNPSTTQYGLIEWNPTSQAEAFICKNVNLALSHDTVNNLFDISNITYVIVDNLYDTSTYNKIQTYPPTEGINSCINVNVTNSFGMLLQVTSATECYINALTSTVFAGSIDNLALYGCNIILIGNITTCKLINFSSSSVPDSPSALISILSGSSTYDIFYLEISSYLSNSVFSISSDAGLRISLCTAKITAYFTSSVAFSTGFVGIDNFINQIVYESGSSTFTSVPVNTPTTPSVPTSGTAQENSNPYAIDVYIYGGDVTEIQITRNGTAYTVLSVSTAIAMSGQSYKLNPGDSITVTYTTAPDWEWMSD